MDDDLPPEVQANLPRLATMPESAPDYTFLPEVAQRARLARNCQICQRPLGRATRFCSLKCFLEQPA